MRTPHTWKHSSASQNDDRQGKEWEGLTLPYQHILLSEAGPNMSPALSGPDSPETAPSLLSHSSGLTYETLVSHQVPKRKAADVPQHLVHRGSSWHQTTPCSKGLSFCQQTSAINSLVLGLKGAKKPLRFPVLCPALSPVSFDFAQQSSTGRKVYRELVGGPQSGLRAADLEGCTKDCRETCPLPAAGRLQEAIGNSVPSTTHAKDRKHSPLTFSTCKAFPSKPFSPPASPAAANL